MKLFHSHHDAPVPEGPLLTADHLAIAFDHPVLRDVSIQVDHGETLAVLGKSGTGKSVLLKLVVGLLTPDDGSILYKGKDITRLNEQGLMELRSEIGFLFQGAALFDSMTVGQNIDIVLAKHTDLPDSEREQKIIEALEMVDLADAIDKMPSELSGGMKKRAGLARSIVLEPELMLYDEPTTGLDPLTASSIAELILGLQTRLGIASIVVTHDLPTAFTVADRAVVLNEGFVAFSGKVEDLEHSKDEFLREYLSASQLNRNRREGILHASPRRQRKLSLTSEAASTQLGAAT
ncbi:MAG: ATP-binding cassette domain-containing protein [Bacteroidota bacterium]|nr:ATP-binding cassette domain-containing protein [Bacteroidota bacterium]MDP4233281.1 ATP-binding cassette domain-containing protein [Bacteroidota bacterium]MDP4242099.1 ATP-binding cassette domain-containing protein [Bacteroidota bacterium]MDP4288622.1 ATP-binding cassette domain-containing protein [Bacteroidota bacterium]